MKLDKRIGMGNSNLWISLKGVIYLLFFFTLPLIFCLVALYSFTSGIPVKGNLTILATIELAQPGTKISKLPGIEQTMKIVSRHQMIPSCGHLLCSFFYQHFDKFFFKYLLFASLMDTLNFVLKCLLLLASLAATHLKELK